MRHVMEKRKAVALSVFAGVIAWNLMWLLQVHFKEGLFWSKEIIPVLVKMSIFPGSLGLLVAYGFSLVLSDCRCLISVNFISMVVLSLPLQSGVFAISLKHKLTTSGFSLVWFEVGLIVSLIIVAVFFIFLDKPLMEAESK